ncbi:uncharacterized protein LOC117109145 [Anneissia japonica]|uniref:uncharacterized protein LOC117109145 n=1 Tax=Anneissia japonica TaxID=1529436 RepID=UPI0014255265|nr:uncharacterized protein LOC117109145 [Anneissia japonica]
MAKTSNYMNMTNNRLESINAKIKSCIHRYSTMPEFFCSLMKCIDVLEGERDQRAAEMVLKVPMQPPPNDIAQYYEVLTPYAYNLVKIQYQLSKEYTVEHQQAGDYYVVCKDKKKLQCDVAKCHCEFFSCMKLPSRHIFAVKKYSKSNVFDESVINERWQKEKYKSSQRLFLRNSVVYESDHGQAVSIQNIPAPKQKKTLTEQQKYKMAMRDAHLLAETMSHASTKKFHVQLNLVKEINRAWRNGRTISVMFSGKYLL